MYGNLDVLQTASAMARHAAQRQALVAANVANADTPGFRARTMPSFSEVAAGARPRIVDRPGPADPNGNTVSVEAEMLDAIEAGREHSRALAIWRHAVGLIRSSLGRGS